MANDERNAYMRNYTPQYREKQFASLDHLMSIYVAHADKWTDDLTPEEFSFINQLYNDLEKTKKRKDLLKNKRSKSS